MNSLTVTYLFCLLTLQLWFTTQIYTQLIFNMIYQLQGWEFGAKCYPSFMKNSVVVMHAFSCSCHNVDITNQESCLVTIFSASCIQSVQGMENVFFGTFLLRYVVRYILYKVFCLCHTVSTLSVLQVIRACTAG